MSKMITPGGALAAMVALLLVSCGGSGTKELKEEAGTVILPATETHQGWYFAAGQRVILAGTVNGDVYAAGGTVEVSDTINGDLLVAGGDVTVSGTVSDDIRVAGGTVRIDGKVGKNVTVAGGNVSVGRNAEISGGVLAFCGNLLLSGTVKKDLLVTGGVTSVSGIVGGNVTVQGDEFSTLPGARVAGNVKARLRDEERMKIADGSVAGRVVFEKSERAQEGKILGRSTGVFWFKILWTAWLLVTGLVMFVLFRKIYLGYSSALRLRLGQSALWGFAAIVVVPIAIIILAITLIGIPFAILLFDISFWLAYFSQLSTALLLGEVIFRNRQSEGWAPFWAFVAGLLIIQAATFIPYVTWLVVIVNLVLGFGALLLLIGDAIKARRTPQTA